MTTATLPDTVKAPTGSGSLIHTVCCDDNRALCGRDVSRDPWRTPKRPDESCVVCEELAEAPTCGAAFCRLRSWWRSR